MPKFSRTLGTVRGVGSELGRHTESVLLGMGIVDDAKFTELREV